MVKQLEKRGLLKLTKGSGTEVYTAREVVSYLKRLLRLNRGPIQRETHPDRSRRVGELVLIVSNPELRVSRGRSTGILASAAGRMATSILQ
jgi:hypothetical protein